MKQVCISLHEVLERYQAGERNFAGITLSSESSKILVDADLSGINLSGVDLSRVGLKRINLSGACLRQTEFLFSGLTSVNLSNADLSHTNLRSTVWSECDLSHACMARSLLFHSSLENANLLNTDMEETILLNSRLKGSINANSLRLSGAFIWNVMMPDGSINKGPLFGDYPN
jgi:uncharacterized protein YjbI with pentapeptide repeats